MLIRRAVSLLLLAAYLPACTAYTQTAVPLAELTAAPSAPPQVRVTTIDGKRMTLMSPRVVNDTLRGISASRSTDAAVLLVPVADIARVELPHKDKGKTMALGVVWVGALVVAMVAMSHAMDDMFSFDGMSVTR